MFSWGQVVTITAWTTLWVTLHELDIVNASCDSSLLGILAGQFFIREGSRLV